MKRVGTKYYVFLVFLALLAIAFGALWFYSPLFLSYRYKSCSNLEQVYRIDNVFYGEESLFLLYLVTAYRDREDRVSVLVNQDNSFAAKLLSSPSKKDRELAESYLEMLTTKEYEEYFARILKGSKDEDRIYVAARALGRMKSNKHIPDIIIRMKDGSCEHLHLLFFSLELNGSPEAESTLLEMVESRDPKLMGLAVCSLDSLNCQRALPHFKKALVWVKENPYENSHLTENALKNGIYSLTNQAKKTSQ